MLMTGIPEAIYISLPVSVKVYSTVDSSLENLVGDNKKMYNIMLLRKWKDVKLLKNLKLFGEVLETDYGTYYQLNQRTMAKE